MELIKAFEVLKKRNFFPQITAFNFDPFKGVLNKEISSKTNITSFDTLTVEKEISDSVLQIWLYPNFYCFVNSVYIIKEADKIAKVFQLPVFIGQLDDLSELLKIINDYEKAYSSSTENIR